MSVNIHIGPYKVLSAGTVIGLPGEDFVFKIYNLEYTIKLKQDASVAGAKYAFYPNEKGRTATIELINFTSSLGVGNNELLDIGDLNNFDFQGDGKLVSVDLLLQFRLFTPDNNTGSTLHYTWLIKPKA